MGNFYFCCLNRILDRSFNFMFNLGRAKLEICCFSGDFYVDVGKLVEFS